MKKSFAYLAALSLAVVLAIVFFISPAVKAGQNTISGQCRKCVRANCEQEVQACQATADSTSQACLTAKQCVNTNCGSVCPVIP